MSPVFLRLACILGQLAPIGLWAAFYGLSIFVASTRTHPLDNIQEFRKAYVPLGTSVVCIAVAAYAGSIVLLQKKPGLFNFSSSVTFWIFIAAAVPLVPLIPIGTGAAAFGVLALIQIRRRRDALFGGTAAGRPPPPIPN